MKKFLFTLVALLMAGSLYAEEAYLYLSENPTHITPEEMVDPVDGSTFMGAEIVVSFHNEGLVSAFDMTYTLPEGLTMKYIDPGADYAISYLNDRGRTASTEPDIQVNMDNNKFIIACMTPAYYRDANNALVSVGVAKWLPGDYEEFLILTVVVDDNFQQGEVSFDGTFGCGQDPRLDDGTYVKPTAGEPQSATVINDAYTPSKLDCAAPVITPEVQTDKVVVTITWNESDGNKVYTGQYEYTRPEYGQPDETYNVEAYTEASNTYNESPHATAIINVPAKDPVWQDVDAPVITPEVQADKVVVTITWPTTTGNQVYTGQYEYTRPEAGEADQSYDVEAYTEADYPYKESAHATATINVPAKEPVVLPTLQGQLVFSEVNQEDGTFTVTYNGNEEGVTVTITDYAVRAGADGQLPNYGTYNVTAVAKKDGYQDLEKTEALTWNAPAPQEKTQDPSVHVTSGNQTKTITCEPNANDSESVIYISLDGGETFEVYTEPIVLGIGEYDIVVYAVAPGKAKSNDVELKVVVDENTQPDPTAVNELNGEKAVAGVRYFNMAGQEMQEANGVTIVVTTYTDGTTSAVKVIK